MLRLTEAFHEGKKGKYDQIIIGTENTIDWKWLATLLQTAIDGSNLLVLGTG